MTLSLYDAHYDRFRVQHYPFHFRVDQLNREGKMNSVRQIEFEVNVHDETEITKVLEMLHDIQKKLSINKATDTELEQMKETLDTGQN